MLKEEKDSLHEIILKIVKDMPVEQEAFGESVDKEAFIPLLEKILIDKVPVYKAMGLDSKFIEALYALAHQLFQSGKYEEAIPFYKMLAQIDGTDTRYIYAVAACYYAQKDWDAALDYYLNAATVNFYDPMPYFYASECQIERGNMDGAIFCLQETIKRATDQSKYAALAERAQLMLETLSKGANN